MTSVFTAASAISAAKIACDEAADAETTNFTLPGPGKR